MGCGLLDCLLISTETNLRRTCNPQKLPRAILENLLMYRLRLTLLNREVLAALVHMAGDNLICISMIPGLVVFAAAGLAVEWLALALLRREQWVSASGLGNFSSICQAVCLCCVSFCST